MADRNPNSVPARSSSVGQMYDELGDDGKRNYAAEFGVTRATIYRHLNKRPATSNWPAPRWRLVT